MDEAEADTEPAAGEEPAQVEEDAGAVEETKVVDKDGGAVEDEAIGDAKEGEEESAPEPDTVEVITSIGDQGHFPMKAVVNWIKETDIVPSERQEDISKVVKDRLNTALVDYADMEGMAAAIESLGGKVSTWVNMMACEAEMELELEIQAAQAAMELEMQEAMKKAKYTAPQGTVYHIKKGDNDCYRVTRVNVIA